MKKLFPIVLTLLLLFNSLFVFVKKTPADQIEDLTNQINSLSQALNESINATTPLESQVSSMQQQIDDIKSQVADIEQNLAIEQQQITDGYKNLNTKKQLLNDTIRNFYIKSSYNSPILAFFSGDSASQITQILQYQKVAADEDKQIITNIALDITALQQKQAALQSEETRLNSVKADLDQQTAKLNTIIAGAKAYQATLSTQIASLTAQQQQLLAQKYATLGIPTTAYTTSGGCSSDINPYKDPGFSGTKFGFFTYGVPNRVGLNQYGAKARAEAGQSYNDILNAYYQNFQLTNMPTSSTNVTVNGTNDYGETFSNQSFTVEDYLTHIYEMPSDWSTEALKAQAIAARSYVMHAIANGQTTVAPNQSFQEVKTEQNAASWISAVQATAGQVMTSGGQPIDAWFSSTFGGYTYTSSDIGWSSTNYTKESQDASGSINSFSDLNNNAWDKNSPWFYCDWGGRASNNNTAWLTSSEVADIANVISLAQADSSTVAHLSQVDKPNPDGTDTWDAGAVQQQLQNRGITPFTSVSSVNVNANFSNGTVTSITINGDAGSKSFDGQSFKQYFDLRAPSNIQIVGPLYNVETHS